MRLGDLYFHHPRIAFAIQTLTACAFGYITHLIQLSWYRENYLFLHVAIWWVLIVLVLIYLAGMPLSRGRATVQLSRDQWSRHFRLNAICDGDAPWFRDALSEELHGDMPTGGPLLRSVCLRMPERWHFDAFETSIQSNMQTATFGQPFGADEQPSFQLDFRQWEYGWCISILNVENAHLDDLREFLLDLHRTVETTDGITRVRWYHDDMLQGGQMSDSDYKIGTDTPIERSTNGT